jgi:hypothetical protein
MSSRPAPDGGNTSMLGGSLGANAIQRTEIIRLPSGSIAPIPSFEALNAPHPGFNRALLFALFVNFICWGFILLAGRALAAVFL